MPPPSSRCSPPSFVAYKSPCATAENPSAPSFSLSLCLSPASCPRPLPETLAPAISESSRWRPPRASTLVLRAPPRRPLRLRQRNRPGKVPINADELAVLDAGNHQFQHLRCPQASPTPPSRSW
jgi:hypothetical protein